MMIMMVTLSFCNTFFGAGELAPEAAEEFLYYNPPGMTGGNIAG